MLNFTIKGLKDKRGNEVNIGDTIKVELPEVIIQETEWDYNGGNITATGGDVTYHRQAAEVLAILYCTASGGLMIKIIKVLDNDDNTDLINKRIKFRYKAWSWMLCKGGE